MEQITEGLPNATAVQLDIMNEETLHHYVSKVVPVQQSFYGVIVCSKISRKPNYRLRKLKEMD